MLLTFLYYVCFNNCEYSVNKEKKLADVFIETQKSTSKVIKHPNIKTKRGF